MKSGVNYYIRRSSSDGSCFLMSRRQSVTPALRVGTPGNALHLLISNTRIKTKYYIRQNHTEMKLMVRFGISVLAGLAGIYFIDFFSK